MDTCSSFFPASVPVFPATLSLQRLASLLPLSLFFGAVTCLSLLSLFSTCHLVCSCSGDCSPHFSSHAHIPPHSRATPHGAGMQPEQGPASWAGGWGGGVSSAWAVGLRGTQGWYLHVGVMFSQLLV